MPEPAKALTEAVKRLKAMQAAAKKAAAKEAEEEEE